MYDESTADQWLSLSEASELLGVHASTLRRWADSGRVPCQRTPGGHRRFHRRKLVEMIEGPSVSDMRDVDPGLASDQAWHKPFARAGLVDRLRETGQRLSGILVQYLMRDDDDERHLSEGRMVGELYAAESLHAGIGLMDALQAFLFYRARFIEILGQSASSEANAVTRRFARYDRFMNQVLLGLIHTYQKG